MLDRFPVRRAGAAAATTVVVAGLVLAASSPADATRRTARDNAVTSGNARFEVLSPTLIRTEYGAKLDGATFNVIGRDDFAPVKFSKRVDRGWLTIDTGAVTLRYKVGSGSFTKDNLTVQLRTGRQTVQAAPWAGHTTPDCAVGALCEAEALALAGPGVATDHTGYTGAGFTAGYSATGDKATFAATPATAGAYQLSVRYANSTGGDGQNVTRTLSVSVDGGAAQTLSLPTTANWDTWALASVPLQLTAGRHEISVVRGAADTGNVNIDSLALVQPGAAYPAPTPPVAQPCAYGQVCEAEGGSLTGGAATAANHNGYSGEGFVAKLESAGAATAVTVTGVPRRGTYQLQLRYANGQAGAQAVQSRTLAVTAGGKTTTATLAPTSGWDYWRTVTTPVTLNAGTNTVSLGCTADVSCNVNLDTVAVTAPGTALLAPHAPLGGYRRGLDGVNGAALTEAGILHQDGWTLLDDSASALYDQRTGKTVVRSKPAQDGYVFAYGQNYNRALKELSVLTGPTKLLPKWTYGVWYSEYYDRTDAEFKQIVQKFKSEGVPLDVLVVDTDFKSPDKWNGWEFDATRFPDPQGFVNWLHKQGLKTSFNIHPSILGSDPHFAAAQATAKGKLQRTGCNSGADCYTFDFGDPDQLKAYFQLHDKMGADPDFWWLDWCCDSSTSTQAGVTGDSWINQQYAQRDGFAFSRAYGSLQAGGYGNPTAVPTGPWADKRTTLHFTGDTSSTWESLQFQVGYTPGEGAATGLAAVSHDIGGHTGGLSTLPGAEANSTKLPDDLYARWVQLGTFQPIDRLHSNHSDRLPWQYGPEADASATKFLKLREKLLPYTYKAAAEATRTGTPITRPLYLAYPGEQEAYATAGAEYLYGPDLLVAPVTTPGTSATTTVWFPPGTTWKDVFTGRTYKGGTTATVTTTLATMPVFLRAGAANPLR
ncbi:TIM-barrel domain-containing protein [Symbioplanes lichenis]|uniref:TIM-barrel domain-containing protein n=1 Tax=Symbioplanes lichenis TaxID=1629072 RepID=UPI0027381C01|nr:TIM-barrel domain-containing protein [Actinoplanes lichenis]